jgi:amino acid transporter
MLVFLSYEGFELIANASDRIADPRRTLPVAFFGSVAAAMVLYLLIVVVTLGYLPLPTIVASQSSVLATASAINADYFGASKLPVMLAEEDEAPEVAGREAWGRHPVGLLAIMVLAVLCAAFLDLHALSAAASAGFLAVFFFVNVANVRLAATTRSIRIIPIVGALATAFALVVLLADLAGGKDPAVELSAIAALFVLPYVYQWGYRRASGAGDDPA